MRTQFYRSFRLAVTLANTTCFYAFMNAYPFPNKQFTEVLTQPEPNGKFVRTVLRVSGLNDKCFICFICFIGFIFCLYVLYVVYNTYLHI